MMGYVLAFLAGIFASPFFADAIRLLWIGGTAFFLGMLVSSLGIFAWNIRRAPIDPGYYSAADLRDGRREPPVGPTR